MPGFTQKDVEKLKGRSVVYNPTTKKFECRGSMTLHEEEVLQQAFEIKKPTSEDVLDALLSDADALQYDTFEDWAPELGYDTDSIKAKKIYEACRKTGSELKKLLGHENFEAAMYEIERL